MIFLQYHPLLEKAQKLKHKRKTFSYSTFFDELQTKPFSYQQIYVHVEELTLARLLR